MTFDLAWASGKFPKLKETSEKLQAKRADLKSIFDEAGPDLDPAKVTSISVKDGKDLHEVVQARNTELETIRGEFDELVETAKAAYNAMHGDGASLETGDGGHGPTPAALARPLGELFIASQAFQGYTSGQGVGPVAKLDIDLAQMLRPQATLFETGAGWAPESTRTGIVSDFPTRPAPDVVDFIPQIPTSQAAVKFMEETSFTNNAAEAAENSLYGEAALQLTERSQDVRKVAVWIPVTDEQIEDEDMARGYVDRRLVFMLRQRVDLQVLQGNGTAPNLEGTENVTGIQSQALGTDSIPDATYKLFTSIRDDGFAEPSVLFIRPSKWQNVALLKTSDGVYIWGHPSQSGPTTMWGVPVKQTTAVTSTKAVAGDYVNHSFLAPRRGVDVQITNAHSDFFVNGKLAIRADVRLAMVHLRPKAFGEVTGL